MNVYEKLSNVRKAIQKSDIQKSGQNSFAKYGYFELSDFLTTVTELCDKERILPVVSFGDGVATMTIYDMDEPMSAIVITSPFGSAALKNCHEVQNIGATETYQRRYLYITAFEIIEPDNLDSGGNDADNTQTAKQTAARNAKKSPVIAKAAQAISGTSAVLCPVCGKDIRPMVDKNGNRWEPGDILTRYGMCVSCYKEQKAAEDGGQG